jgi:hypothetical protein
MNDRHEMRTGAELLMSLFERHKGYLDTGVLADIETMLRSATSQDPYKTFVVCGCKNPNNLTMWRNYTGPEVGFAVGLDATKALSMRRQKLMTEEMVDKLGILERDSNQEVFENARRDLGSFPWRDAVYHPESQIEIAWGRLKELESASVARSNGERADRHELDVMSDIYNELQTFKHSDFEDEREMRAVCWGRSSHRSRLRESSGQQVRHRPIRRALPAG